MTRTQNVSEYMLVVALCLVFLLLDWFLPLGTVIAQSLDYFLFRLKNFPQAPITELRESCELLRLSHEIRATNIIVANSSYEHRSTHGTVGNAQQTAGPATHLIRLVLS